MKANSAQLEIPLVPAPIDMPKEYDVKGAMKALFAKEEMLNQKMKAINERYEILEDLCLGMYYEFLANKKAS